MNGAANGTSDAGAGANANDLDSVLNRFQEWTKAQSENPPAKFGSSSTLGRSKATKKVDLAQAACEPSYEHALRASNYRRPVFPAANDSPVQPPAPIQRVAEDLAAANPEVRPLRIKVPKASNSRAQHSSLHSHRADPRAVKKTRAEDAEPTPERRKATTRSATKPEEVAGNIGRAGPSGSIRKTTPSPRVIDPERAFRDVFQSSAGLTAMTKTASIRGSKIPENKCIALSLRVSDVEQAQIQAGAARTSLSVSAYLRQCALSVDELREQVELALDELHKRDVKPPPVPRMKDIPAIFGRFATHLFDRLRSRHDYTGISLR